LEDDGLKLGELLLDIDGLLLELGLSDGLLELDIDGLLELDGDKLGEFEDELLGELLDEGLLLGLFEELGDKDGELLLLGLKDGELDDEFDGLFDGELLEDGDKDGELDDDSGTSP